MSKMKMPTKEQILKASESCEDAKTILEKLYPEAFEEDEKLWEDVTFLPSELEKRDGSYATGIKTDDEDFYMVYDVTFEDVWMGDRLDENPTTEKYMYKLVDNRIYRKKL